jgi:hypothetical protein
MAIRSNSILFPYIPIGYSNCLVQINFTSKSSYTFIVSSTRTAGLYGLYLNTGIAGIKIFVFLMRTTSLDSKDLTPLLSDFCSSSTDHADWSSPSSIKVLNTWSLTSATSTSSCRDTEGSKPPGERDLPPALQQISLICWNAVLIPQCS